MKKVRQRTILVRLALALALLALALATAYADPPGTERVSVGSGGIQATGGDSNCPSISADGRYVAFHSVATNLVAGDTNGFSDIFLHDRQTDQTIRVNVSFTGTQAAGGVSFFPSISADGHIVAFQSAADNLIDGDNNNRADIFVRNRQLDETFRVSVDSTGNYEGDDHSYDPSISADGRYVAFSSAATNLVTGDTNGNVDTFVHEIGEACQTTRVSVDSTGAQATGGGSGDPSISADGRYVAFESFATDLVTGDSNAQPDIFVHDRQTGQTTRVSVDSAGGQATGGGSYNPAISADGRYVAFQSGATNLVIGDSNAQTDVFVRDRQTGQTTRVSVDSTGGQATGGGSYNSAISADGRYVAFESDATNLVDGDSNAQRDIFVHDRQTGQTTRLNLGPADAQATGGDSRYPSISADGRYVAFSSTATDLVTGDTNALGDVFVRSRGDPALVITKQDNPDPVWARELLTYTLTISETGGLFDATGMVVSDTVPANTTCCLSISDGGAPVGGEVLWAGLTVSSSQGISVTFVVTVNQVSSGTVIYNNYYRAVISTTQGTTGATGNPVTTTVWAESKSYLPTIQRNLVITR